MDGAFGAPPVWLGAMDTVPLDKSGSRFVQDDAAKMPSIVKTGINLFFMICFI